jgi:hypothetical protein
MSAYDACSGCDRYVKREDSVCPFCGMSVAAIGGGQGRPRLVRARPSRAAWLAYASTLTMAGCVGGKTVASDSVAQPASKDLPSQDAKANNTGPFACGADQDADLSCDPNTQYCFDDTYDYTGGYHCVAKDEGPLAAAHAGVHCPCPPDDSGTIGCLFSGIRITNSSGQDLCSGNFSCEEDESGAITVACHSCYGSPPARLERLG